MHAFMKSLEAGTVGRTRYAQEDTTEIILT